MALALQTRVKLKNIFEDENMHPNATQQQIDDYQTVVDERGEGIVAGEEIGEQGEYHNYQVVFSGGAFMYPEDHLEVV